MSVSAGLGAVVLVAVFAATAFVMSSGGGPDHPTISPDTVPTTTSTTVVPPVRSEIAPAGGIATQDALLSSRAPAIRAEPVRVEVASVGIDATVVAVGIDDRGAVAVPSEPGIAGWYRFGAAPGDVGSAVIAAHVNYDGRLGPFSSLGRVEPGSEVLVTTSTEERRYVVTSRRVVPKELLPSPDLFRTDGPEQLVLITCGGDLDVAKHSYVDNVIVVAVPA